MSIPYIITDTSVTVIVNFTPKIIDAKNPNFKQVVDLLKSGTATEAQLLPLLDIPKTIETFTGGNVYVKDGKLYLNGAEVRTSLGKIIMNFVRTGQPELAEPLKVFLANVAQNPDPRAQIDLYDWLVSSNLPITPDGHILAWKAVTDNYRSLYCPSDERFDHRIGQRVEMPRDECNADPTVTCSTGLHFCGAAYLKSYLGGGARIVVVKIHPKDVVSFPTDYQLQKGRACGYEIVGEVPNDQVKNYYPQGVPVYTSFTPKPKLDVRVGGVYRCRDGKAVVVTEIVPLGSDTGARFNGSTLAGVWGDGRRYNDGRTHGDDLIAEIEFPLGREDFHVGDRWVTRGGEIVTIKKVESIAITLADGANDRGLFSDTGRQRPGKEKDPNDLVYNLDYGRDRTPAAPRLGSFAVGQTWETRIGQLVVITSISEPGAFPIKASNGANYQNLVEQRGEENRIAYYLAYEKGESALDLVKLVKDVK